MGFWPSTLLTCKLREQDGKMNFQQIRSVYFFLCAVWEFLERLGCGDLSTMSNSG